MGVRAQNNSMAVTGSRMADFVLFIKTLLSGRITHGLILFVYLHSDIYTPYFKGGPILTSLEEVLAYNHIHNPLDCVSKT
jgi:hypothetical protein